MNNKIVKSDGEIRVHVETQEAPIMTWKDPMPLPIEYFGFASYGNSLNQYYYNCASEQPVTQAKLERSCSRISTLNYDYEHFIPIARERQPNGYVLDFKVYVRATRDAHILLSPDQKGMEDVYEIGNDYAEQLCPVYKNVLSVWI